MHGNFIFEYFHNFLAHISYKYMRNLKLVVNISSIIKRGFELDGKTVRRKWRGTDSTLGFVLVCCSELSHIPNMGNLVGSDLLQESANIHLARPIKITVFSQSFSLLIAKPDFLIL
jgi:hypothetical protein